jgi:hypothetical protein
MKNLRVEYFFLLLLFAANLWIGITVVSDYGESWDEARLYEYGDQSLNAYRALLNSNLAVDFGTDDLRYYGPAYFMGVSLIVRATNIFLPQIPIIDLWHMGNFLCLQFGLLCFYFLARRFFPVMPALGTTALFAFQPLFWGHGFINPKDIPFMAFFTASVYFGLRMLDDFANQNFDLRALLKPPTFFLAAAFLGITISIRILGFAAAGIVLGYFAFISLHKVLRLSYVYFGSALLVSFLTWPFLWSSPVTNFIQAIYAMLKFQWIGQTLFNGTYFPTNQLPQRYVPQLLLMQITEPAVILFFIGIAVILLPRLRPKYKGVGILFLFWFAAPMLYILIIGMNLYDNTRQLFFILPGAFLMIAAGLDFVLSWLSPLRIQILILGLILLPGIAGILNYHPYEYTYYNYAATSSTPIYRKFETDYWATSFKQAATYLNRNAPENSLVIVWGPSQIVRRYARDDIQVKSFDEIKDSSYAKHPYYLILTTRYDMDLKFFPEIQPVYSVQKNKAVFTVIKYITPGD